MNTLSWPLLCIAHRGGSQTFTENTFEAFEQALQLGVDAIELDVWLVGDELLITHDRRLGKTLPGQGLLLQQDPQQLRQLTLACGGHVTTLPEVLALVGNKALLNIELKGPHCAEAVMDALVSYSQDHNTGLDHYVISSFDHRQLWQCQQRFPQVRRGLLVEGIPLNYAAAASELQAFSLNPSLNFVDAELVNDAKKRGLDVWVYTVNEEEDMHQMAELGVDGVFTDYPARLQALNPAPLIA